MVLNQITYTVPHAEREVNLWLKLPFLWLSWIYSNLCAGIRHRTVSEVCQIRPLSPCEIIDGQSFNPC